ncbi:hypothetical protein [Falsiroseomonas sp.]|uniref:hypothetical protein n=1 Tax=Falsiroseomonas sp. TaxID=2870721 RepID=UPI002735A0B1|nr:hypothetical protein [Falsiroseomonas sp.]MDP3418490.1 hypothetical protein [Falsiroseomonas sp.]
MLLALSVGGKVIAGNQSLRGVEQAMQNTEKGQVIAFLYRQGFQMDATGIEMEDVFLPVVAGDCHLVAVLAAPQGWHRDITHRVALPEDQIFFVVGAKVYQDQPAWGPWIYHYWRVLNLYVGRKLLARPVLGIVATPECDLRDMPWQEIAELS